MEPRDGRSSIPGMDGQAKADGSIRVEVSLFFREVVENLSRTLIDYEGGCFEVNGRFKVVVFGQLVWVNKYVGWERIESMERTRRMKKRNREAGEESRMKAR